MKARRRQLRREKREQAEHHRALNIRRFNELESTKDELRRIAAQIGSKEELNLILAGFDAEKREAMINALRPFLRIRLGV